jgi:acetyl esterase/lipase
MKYEEHPVPLDYAKAGLAQPQTKSVVKLFIPDFMDDTPPYKRPLLVLCPGGGYRFVSPREGEPVALQFLAADMAVLELDYAVSPDKYPVALFELAASVLWARKNAAEWGIDTDRIILCGFSAGGHLAGSLCVYWSAEFLSRALDCDAALLKPNGAILSYAVISSDKTIYHGGSVDSLYGPDRNPDEDHAFSLDKHAGPHCPPTFLWHTSTDNLVPVENSLCYAAALAQYKVPFELHVYPAGPHGLSLATPAVGIAETPEYASLRLWPHLAIEWIRRHV